jgi:large subunit ribosomal protein L21e
MANKKAKGKRSLTRSRYRRNVRAKTTVNELIKPIKVDDVVQVNANSSVHNGLPHRRMDGITGKVIGFQGNCPVVQLKTGNKTKKVITHRVHLKLLKQIAKGEKNDK